MKMGCVVKGHFIEMPINQSLDIFMTNQVLNHTIFYLKKNEKSSRKI